MNAQVQPDGSSMYINDFIECQPPSPSSNLSHLDSSITFNPLASPYNGSYNNSPFSGHSELSYIGDSDLSFPGFLDEDSTSAIRDYDPADYDPPHQSSLLMFSDADFMNPYETPLPGMGAELHSNKSYDYSSPSSNASAEDRNRSRASSVSSNPHSHHPTPNHYSSSPRVDVAQSFENLKFSPSWGTDPLPLSEPVQKHPSPPRLLMPDGPPTINAPDGDGPLDGSVSGPSLHIVPATPISGGGHPNDAVPFPTRLNNLSAHSQPPWADPGSSSEHAGGSSSNPQSTPQQQQQHFLQQSQNLITHTRSVPGTPSSRQLILEDVNTPAAGAPGTGSATTNTSYLFPQPLSKSRSKSDPALEPLHWDTPTATALLNQSANNSAIDDGTGAASGAVTMQEVQGQSQSYTSPSSTGQMIHGFNFPPLTSLDNATSNNNNLNHNFLSPPGPIRRVKSDSSRPIIHRHTQSDDIRSLTPLGSPPSTNLSLFYPGSGTVPNSAPAPSSASGFLSPHPQTHVTRFLSPGLDGSSVPAIRSSHRHTRSLTGHLTPNYTSGLGHGPIRRSPSSTRSERGSVWSEASGYSGGSAGGAGLGSNRVSPYPSPKASPRPAYGDLPPSQAYDDTVGMGVGRVSGWMGGMNSANPNGNQHLPMQQQQQQPQPQAHNNGSMYGIDSHPHPQGVMLPPGLGPTPGNPMGGLAGHVAFSEQVNMNVVPSQRVRVKKNNVTTDRTKIASVKRRKADATFTCPVAGCGSTFTRSFNLRGHMRSHNEEKPFTCRWLGCTKAFARQHDCKRHEALHTNYRPFTCDGCQKQFARMDALNRHLRSEGGADCAKVQKPASLSDGLGVGDQVAPNGIHMSDGYDGQMDVDDLLGDVGDSSAESSGAEETKPRMTKLEDEWSTGITL